MQEVHTLASCAHWAISKTRLAISSWWVSIIAVGAIIVAIKVKIKSIIDTGCAISRLYIAILASSRTV